jgi:hypothetical protein
MNWYQERSRLQIEKMKMDKFFSMFLEKFERKMDPDKPNTPVWKLYKDKLKEYEKLSHGIKTADYWISKDVQNS